MLKEVVVESAADLGEHDWFIGDQLSATRKAWVVNILRTVHCADIIDAI